MSKEAEEKEVVLTDKQRRFCEEYVVDWNATQAAIRAGYSKKTAYSIGSENLTKDYLVDYINSIKPAAVKKIRVDFKNKKLSNTGHIYLIQCIGSRFFKIGMTKRSPMRRLKCLQTSIPFDLKLKYSWEFSDVSQVEKVIHAKYEKHRKRGEWFEFNDPQVNDVIGFISQMKLTRTENLNLFGKEKRA